MFNTVVDFVEIKEVFKSANALASQQEVTNEGIHFFTGLFNKCTLDQKQILASEFPAAVKLVGQ